MIKNLLTILFAVLSFNLFSQSIVPTNNIPYDRFGAIVGDTLGDGTDTVLDVTGIIKTLKGNSNQWDSAFSYTSNFVSITDYGAKGNDSVDDTQAFLDAVGAAALIGAQVYLPDGRYFIYHDTAIVMNGTTGLIGMGILDISKYKIEDEPIKPVFIWEGDTLRITDDYVNITEGLNNVTINLGENIVPGDVVFQVSPETLPYYTIAVMKSQRLTVKTYDDATGEITFYEPFNYTLDSAIFFLQTNPQHVILKDFKIEGSADSNHIEALEINNGFLYAENIEISNCHALGLNIVNSLATVIGFKSYSNFQQFDIDSLSTQSYGIVVSNFTDATIISPNIRGGRHAITTGGTNYWWADILFDKPRQRYFVNNNTNIIGGYLSNNTEHGVINSHSSDGNVFVRGALIYGGVDIANNFTIENTIFRPNSYTDNIFNIGGASQIDSLNRNDWAIINNVKVISHQQDKNLQIVRTLAPYQIDITNLKVWGDWPDVGVNQIFQLNGSPPAILNIDGYYHESGKNDNSYCFFTADTTQYQNIHINGGVTANFSPVHDNSKVTVKNFSSKNSNAVGAAFSSQEGAINLSAEIEGVNITNSSDRGLTIQTEYSNASLKNASLENNTGQAIEMNTGGVLSLNMQNVSFEGNGGNISNLGRTIDTIAMINNRADNEVFQDYLLNSNGDIRPPLFDADLNSALQNYVPATGGTFTGNVVIDNSFLDINDGSIYLNKGFDNRFHTTEDSQGLQLMTNNQGADSNSYIINSKLGTFFQHTDNDNPIIFRGSESGIGNNLLRLDPDSSASLYYNGDLKLQTGIGDTSVVATGTIYTSGGNSDEWNSVIGDYVPTTGGTFTGPIVQDFTVNSDNLFRVDNGSAGTSASARLAAFNDLNGSMSLSMIGSNYTDIAGWANKGILYTNDLADGMILHSNSNPIQVSTTGANTPDLFVDGNGNVGINEASPSQALDITGNVNINASGLISTQLINLNSTNGTGIFMNIQEMGVDRGRFDYSFGSNYIYMGVTDAGGSSIIDALTVMSETDNNFVGINTSSPTERLHVVGNVQVDGDISANNVPVYSTGSAVLDFPSTATNDYSELTITVTGAVVGDQVLPVIVPTASITDNSIYESWVSNPDEVTVRFLNNGAVTAKDPASGTYTVRVMQF